MLFGSLQAAGSAATLCFGCHQHKILHCMGMHRVGELRQFEASITAREGRDYNKQKGMVCFDF